MSIYTPFIRICHYSFCKNLLIEGCRTDPRPDSPRLISIDLLSYGKDIFRLLLDHLVDLFDLLIGLLLKLILKIGNLIL